MLTAAEARTRGTATADQRDELHTLIAGKAVDRVWVQRFYQSVLTAEGLSADAASDALIYLRSLAARNDQPTHATPEQGEALRGLARSRILPGRIRRIWLGQLDAGTLTYQIADRTILEWLRAPKKPYVDPAELRPGGGAPDGYYALIAADGTPRCYRIHTRPGSGARVVERITGDRRDQRRKVHHSSAHQVITTVALNPDTAAALYGATRKRCAACNQPLRRTDQPGYPHGYGLDCWTAKQRTAAAAVVLTGAQNGDPSCATQTPST